MDFGYTEEQQKLRKEIHDFLVNELPSDYEKDLRVCPVGKELEDFWWSFQKKCCDLGYATSGWPKKYGGKGYTAVESTVVNEEMEYFGGEWTGMIGITELAPVVLVVGTEGQKEKFIPPIARGETYWAQCFTEPNAGSDEANVQLKAVPEGDHYILNGQKTFMTLTKKPDWLYTLTRTKDSDPPHRGITIFMVPGNAPGISYGALPTMGSHMQVDVFYDDVKVPKENLIGELNRGFYHAMATFEFERGHAGAHYRRAIEDWVEFCRNETRNGKPLIKDPKAREMLVRKVMDLEVEWLIGWYAAWRSANREKVGSSPYDILGTLRKDPEHGSRPRAAKDQMNLFGLYGQLKPESKYAKKSGVVQRDWEVLGGIHSGGTVEIYKLVIASRGLGLPRVPRQFNKPIYEALQKAKD